jgi:hypothetical protein
MDSVPQWIKRYWKLYGGWRALLFSPYLAAAFIFVIPCVGLWQPGADAQWADMSINVLPNLMGFSIAGMTIMLAFSHPESLRAITQKGKETSYFLKVSANLCHFLAAQIVALLFAFVRKSGFDWSPFSYCGVLALLYAILVSIGAAGQLFNTAFIMNKAAGSTSSGGGSNGAK